MLSHTAFAIKSELLVSELYQLQYDSYPLIFSCLQQQNMWKEENNCYIPRT